MHPVEYPKSIYKSHLYLNRVQITHIHAHTLMDNETLLQYMYDTAPLLIGIITIEDNDFRYLKANRLTLEFFGKQEHEVVGHLASELGTPREYIDLWIKHSLESERRNAPIYFDYERKKTAETLYFTAHAIYLGIGTDSKKYYAYMTQDITEKRVAHIENARLLSDMNALLNATTEVSIISTNLEGTINFFNKGAEKMLGYTADEVVGKHSPKLYHTKEEVAAREKEAASIGNDVVKSHEVFTANKYEPKEFTYVCKDGNTIPVQLVVTPKIDAEGHRVGYVGVATDISKIKAVEQDLAEVNKELGAFAYIVSHDLQEPLRIIRGFISILDQKYVSQLDENAKRYMGLITDAATRMQDMIRDILEYSRQTKVVIKYEEVDLDSLVREVREIFLTSARMPPVIEICTMPTIAANKLSMEQLFTNLIGNAIKYQPAGNAPIIHINVVEGKEYWDFSVSDNGIGIAKENYSKVFTLFKRLHTRAEYDGTGIGLSICQKIVQHHKGKIWIEPSPLGGTTFRFTISKLLV